jgi:GNAT superfamily N-acetyltransferase
MTEPPVHTEPEIAFEAQPSGDTRAELRIDGRAVSRLFIVPFTLRIGAAAVRMDGIAGVETEKEHRRRGYSRRVLEATVDWMRQGDAALSMLYGIPDFYPKFGYATAGPDHLIELPGPFGDTTLPSGWAARPFAPANLPALQRLYDENTARAVGAAVRSEMAGPWTKLAALNGKGGEECRVVMDSQAQIRGYAWRARWTWYVINWERNDPEAMVIAEAMAEGPASADAVLAACRAWAAEESETRSQPAKRVILSLPPEGPVAAAAMQQRAHFSRRYQACGGSMVRVLDVERLLRALQPELTTRLRAAGSPFSGRLQIQTEMGGATLRVSSGCVLVEDQSVRPAATPPVAPPPELALRLRQSTLARLALGAFPPEDLLARLEAPPDEKTRQLLQILFPLRHPHMYLPDRF